MVGYTISVPVKENNVAGDRLIPAILPQVLFFKPGNTAVTIGKLGYYAGCDKSVLIRAPADKAGAPLYTA